LKFFKIMYTETLTRAKELWDYMSALKTQTTSDAVVICCSYDLRVCDYACYLINKGFSSTLVISGKSGNWTRHIWSKPEAEVFFDRAITNGVDESQILLEPEATNLGENINFSRKLIPHAKTVTFVSKPNTLLRIKLTAEAQWPEVNALVSCPEIEFPAQVSNIIGLWGIINEMVGDIERIQKYPEKGYQARHSIPAHILRSSNWLLDQGFSAHLMPD
jgi:hypothetical protein